MTKSYYNTTHQTGLQLSLFEEKAHTQDEKVLQLFKQYKELSASQCWKLWTESNVPITSLRRSITNLTDAGKLEQTEKKVMGLWGREEYVWKILN